MWKRFFKSILPANLPETDSPQTSSEQATETGDFILGNYYPAPASGYTIIPFTLTVASEVRLTLYSCPGEKRHELEIGAFGAGPNTTLLQVHNLPAGDYTCEVMAENAYGVFTHTQPLTIK